MKRICLLLLAAMSMLPAMAQKGQMSVGIGAGLMFRDAVVLERIDYKLTDQRTFRSNWDLEFKLRYQTSNRIRIEPYVGYLLGTSGRNEDIFIAGANVNYIFTNGVVKASPRTYVLLGAGYADGQWGKTKSHLYDDQYKGAGWTVKGGFGLDYNVSTHVYVNLEIAAGIAVDTRSKLNPFLDIQGGIGYCFNLF